jgi:hypothetical protein
MLLLALISSVTYADGLIHRLPEDGASVSYKMEVTMVDGEESKTTSSTITVSSVGQTTVDDEKCRWIEFKIAMKFEGRQVTTIFKALIPEAHLGSGKTPIDHVKKCWHKQGDGAAREVDNVKGRRGAPLHFFLSGPLKNAKSLKPEIVESKLGKLSCKGTSGRLEFRPNDRNSVADIETRLHEKAPFGVVTSKIKAKAFVDSRRLANITMTFKLIDVGKNAKSELPDAK